MYIASAQLNYNQQEVLQMRDLDVAFECTD